MFAVLAVELLVLRAWLDSASPSGQSAVWLTQTGPGTLRFFVVQCSVAFAMLSLIFGASRVAAHTSALSDIPQRGIAWVPLLAHAAAGIAVTAILTTLVSLPLSSVLVVLLNVVWIASALSAVGFLAIACLRFVFWTLVFRQVRDILAFALVIGVAAFAFGRAAVTLWQPLSRATFTVASAMLHPFIHDVSADASTLTMGNPAFLVRIEAACSGYEGLGLILAFTIACLWFQRLEWRFPQALLLVPIGLTAMWALNCLRVAGLVLIGIAGAPDVAMGGFHTQAGWVAFNIVALSICLAARRVPWLLKDVDRTSSVDTRSTNPTLPYLLPFLALLVGSMLAQLATAGFESLYAIRVVLGVAVLCAFARKYRGLDWRVEWTSVGLGLGAFAIWIGAEALVGSGLTTHDMPGALRDALPLWRISWLVSRVIGAGVAVPVAEELAFRGFLLRRFQSDDFEHVRHQSVSWLAILFSSAAFGVLHGDRWLAGTVAGILYALAYLRRGSMGDAVAAHATTNALLAAAVLGARQWQLWS
jgi:exosortase E/protease (VPEID-CTERM system)